MSNNKNKSTDNNDTSMAISPSIKEDIEYEKKLNEISMFSHWDDDDQTIYDDDSSFLTRERD